MHDAARHPQKRAEHAQHADQTELLADHGQQEIGVGFGQPVQLFHAAAQADAKNFAAAEGDQRMRQLVALAQRVDFAPRVQVGEDPLAPPLRQRDHQREGNEHHRGDQEEHPGVDAAEEQDSHGDHRDHHERAHVGLGQKQRSDHGNGDGHRQHGTEKTFLHIHLAHHVIGGIEQHGELGQLRRLESHDAERNPAPRAVDN